MSVLLSVTGARMEWDTWESSVAQVAFPLARTCVPVRGETLVFRPPCLFVLKASLFGPRTTSSKRCCQAPEYTPSSYDKGWNGQGRNGAAQIGRSGEAGFHRLNPLYNRTDAGSKRYFRMGRECRDPGDWRRPPCPGQKEGGGFRPSGIFPERCITTPTRDNRRSKAAASIPRV